MGDLGLELIETKTHCAAALGWKLVGGEIDLKTNSPSPLLPLFPRQHVFGVFLSRVIVPPTGQPPGGVVSPFFFILEEPLPGFLSQGSRQYWSQLCNRNGDLEENLAQARQFR